MQSKICRQRFEWHEGVAAKGEYEHRISEGSFRRGVGGIITKF